MGNTKKQKLFNNLKVVLAVAFFIIALGVVGQQDYEYETRPSVCREWQGDLVCYQP